VQVADFSRTLLVSGDRTWVPTARGIAMSRTRPFVSMPMDYSHAFGGAAFDPSGIEAFEPANPAGAGLCLSDGHAPSTRLPNVEEVDQLMSSWRQRPLPAGLLPLPRDSDLRGTRGIEVDLERRTTTLTPLAFVSSHPRMHLPTYPARAVVTVVGMSPTPWQFLLPDLHLCAEISLGSCTHRLRLTPDTLCLLPGERRFWVVARRAFVYQFIRERVREVRLSASSTPAVDGPFTTIAREMESSAPTVPILPPDLPENMPVPWDMLRELNPLTSVLERLPLLASG
jgi:hypothetical protein